MARISSPELDQDENGLFLPLNGQHHHPHSPNGSSASSAGGTSRETDITYDILSSSRDTEASGVTPTRPLLVARHTKHSLKTGQNGINKTSSIYGDNHNIKTKRKRKYFWKGKEHLCCLCGTVMFLLGAIFLCVALILFVNSRTVSHHSTEPISSALYNDVLDSTESSPIRSEHHSDVTRLPSTTSTQPTSTVNYDELVNIASGLDEFAYQSSTHQDTHAQYSLKASNVVDGSANYTLSSDSCTLTESQLQPFWWLDMLNYKLVKRVRIFKPTDCCDDGLTDFEVRIGQAEELDTNALCKRYPGANLEHVIEVVCPRQIYGRYVSIQLLGSDGIRRQLALCEVEIYTH